MKTLLFITAALFALNPAGSGQTMSPLLARGYTVLPTPQHVALDRQDIEFTHDWRLELGPGTKDDIAAEELTRLLAERHHFAFQNNSSQQDRIVRLAIVPGTITVTRVAESNKTILAEQAYRLSIRPDQVSITGNSAVGLFYGVQTFAQLLKEESGRLLLPEATIEDWPDLEMRVIYWDDAHHVEHLDDLKRAIRQAAFYKINGFSIKLEGHFQYTHALAIVEPYALSPSDYQDLTNYALRYHVQLIPYLDGPAHDAFILKHPEYASLREYRESNYEFCVTNPGTYKLFDGMLDDLLAANQGGKYFVLSTDEPYYIGLADNEQCHEADRAEQLGSVGKLLAEFITKTSTYLHERGRTVIFWGEYPMKPEDIGALPAHLINGEVYGPQFDRVFHANGIRQMVYTFTEGEEQLFPRYYVLPPSSLLHSGREDSSNGRVKDMLDSISFNSTSDLSSVRPGPAHSEGPDLMGVFIAGWADAGLHPETFWLGYATGPAAGWNRHALNAQELASCFYSLFYGRESTNMGRVYQLMSEGAQRWEDSWETGPSTARKPIWGDSYHIFHPPRPARDQLLPPLPVLSQDLLRLSGEWSVENRDRLKLAASGLAENDELLDLLYLNLQRVQFNRYNLTVYASIAALYRQNLFLIQSLGQIADLLRQAQECAVKDRSSAAVEYLDRALDSAAAIRKDRNTVLANATATWYQTWYPRVANANGRTYLHELDDVKDHQPARTVDMSYLVYRELLYPLGDWAASVLAARNSYSKNHGLPARDFTLDWKNTSALNTEATNITGRTE